jgi:hypothetical protein
MKTRLGVLSLLCCVLPQAAFAEVPVMTFDEVQQGMKGTGRTVFDGTRVETFQVEILGKLPKVAPDQNLILGRCSGGPLEQTGVLAGMSGSPVTIDGKLVGAVAYTWGFSKDAIAGITPIEEMLAISEIPESQELPTGSLALQRRHIELLREPEQAAGYLQDGWHSLLGRNTGLFPVALPLAVSGVGYRGLERLRPELVDAGFLPMLAGSSGGDAAPTPRLQPGSAVGLKLVRGDLEFTATGTATWVDDGEVLAFGHPLFGLGEVDLPLTGATVQALLPSYQQSARIATPLAEVGALRQDRSSGVLGRLDVQPRMIPVRLQLTGHGGAEHTFSFDIADDPLLSPLLLYVSLQGILASKERGFGSATVRLKQGSVIKMFDGNDVELDNIFAGPTAFDYGTGIAAYILHLLMNNAWSRPEIAGVNLLLEYRDAPLTSTIRRATLDRYRVPAGDSVQATIVLDPFRGPDRVFTRTIRIPEETPAGTLSLHVGGAQSVSRTEGFDEPVLPRDLGQLIRLINRLRRNDRIYIVASKEDTGILLGGTQLPNLPPSVGSVLSRPRSRGNYTVVSRRSVLEEVIPTDYAVQGLTRIQLQVEAR